MFTQQSTRLMDGITQRQPGISLHSHSPVHNELMVYIELVHWMKDCENGKFVEVLKVSLAVGHTYTLIPKTTNGPHLPFLRAIAVHSRGRTKTRSKHSWPT